MALKTNYKDDVLDLTQNANRKFQEIENQDGSISFNDVTVYEEIGDTYGATDINETNTVVNSHNSALQVGTNETDLIRFAKDGSGNYGYKKVGSEAFYPFQTKHTETYRPTSRANNLDMGEYHKKRYVDTTAVPNINSSTYSVTSNGTKDMGETNTNRYLSVNVPATVAAGSVARSTTGRTKITCGFQPTSIMISVTSNAAQRISRYYNGQNWVWGIESAGMIPYGPYQAPLGDESDTEYVLYSVNADGFTLGSDAYAGQTVYYLACR